MVVQADKVSYTVSIPEIESNTRRIILTGASGFLGQHLLSAFLTNPPPGVVPVQQAEDDEDETTADAAGNAVCHHIIALYRSVSGFPEAVQALTCATNVDVTVECLDITKEEQVKAWLANHTALTSSDVCIHTAAMSSPKHCQQNAEAARACNVPTFFFDVLQKRNVEIIAFSTDQVYNGTHPPYRETDERGGPSCNMYGTTKIEMEDYLLQPTFYDSSAVTVLRSSIMLGPKAPILPDVAHTTFLHFCATRSADETEFYTDECRSIVAVQDVVTVLQRLVALKRNGAPSAAAVFNLGGPESVSRFDMARAVFAHLHYAPQYLIAKKKAGLPVGPVPSPLDITMDSSKIQDHTQLQFQTLNDLVRATFV
jgi:dTDP-4-dehydrorhamnose reductase